MPHHASLLKLSFFSWCCFHMGRNYFYRDAPHPAKSSEFQVIWNMETTACMKFGIDLELEKFGIEQNTGKMFYGDKINIFYKIGKFPYIDEEGQPVNGGIPQLGDLHGHLQQAARDVDYIIPDKNFSGFGVLDWEDWRPDWDTNWKPFSIYREQSILYVERRYPNISKESTAILAKILFEKSARMFMETLLNLVTSIRPNALWGYYGFPHCYNYEDWQKNCSLNIQKDNSEIQWLYNASTALYPSIYIGNSRTSELNAVYVYGILAESRRVTRKLKRPIFPYSIVHYRSTMDYMNRTDLMLTIGQTAALGFPGVILWGRYLMVNTREKCQTLQKFVMDVLGPTVAHVKQVVESRDDRLAFGDDIPSDQWLSSILKFYS